MNPPEIVYMICRPSSPPSLGWQRLTPSSEKHQQGNSKLAINIIEDAFLLNDVDINGSMSQPAIELAKRNLI
jgi:hypothetical protein